MPRLPASTYTQRFIGQGSADTPLFQEDHPPPKAKIFRRVVFHLSFQNAHLLYIYYNKLIIRICLILRVEIPDCGVVREETAIPVKKCN